MRVLFDNGVPRGLAAGLSGHHVEEARDHGWDSPSIVFVESRVVDCGDVDRSVRLQRHDIEDVAESA